MWSIIIITNSFLNRNTILFSDDYNCRARQLSCLGCLDIYLFIYNYEVTLWLHVGVCAGTAAMEGCFLAGVHIQRLLTSQFLVSFRDVPSFQNMSASFTNVCSVGALSTANNELVVWSMDGDMVELLRKTQKAEAKGYSYIHRRTAKNSESLTDCANRVDPGFSSRRRRRLKRRIARVRLCKLTTVEVLLRHLQGFERVSLCPVYAAV